MVSTKKKIRKVKMRVPQMSLRRLGLKIKFPTVSMKKKIRRPKMRATQTSLRGLGFMMSRLMETSVRMARTAKVLTVMKSKWKQKRKAVSQKLKGKNRLE